MSKLRAKDKKVQSSTDKKLTVTELKFWLSGILEFQTNEWIPNKNQWETIKNKIFELEEQQVVIQHSNVFQQAQSVDNMNSVTQPVVTRPAAPLFGSSLLDDAPNNGGTMASPPLFPQLSKAEEQAQIARLKAGLPSGMSVEFNRTNVEDKFVV